MINTVTAGPAASDGALNPKTPEPTREPEPGPAKLANARPPDAAPPKSDLRLVIKRDKDNAFYVYRLVDRSTGEVVVELPRHQVSDLATDASERRGAP